LKVLQAEAAIKFAVNTMLVSLAILLAGRRPFRSRENGRRLTGLFKFTAVIHTPIYLALSQLI
jgi:multisubunit Na+/H+ antiporter MnhE subunit